MSHVVILAASRGTSVCYAWCVLPHRASTVCGQSSSVELDLRHFVRCLFVQPSPKDFPQSRSTRLAANHELPLQKRLKCCKACGRNCRKFSACLSVCCLVDCLKNCRFPTGNHLGNNLASETVRLYHSIESRVELIRLLSWQRCIYNDVL